MATWLRLLLCLIKELSENFECKRVEKFRKELNQPTGWEHQARVGQEKGTNQTKFSTMFNF